MAGANSTPSRKRTHAEDADLDPTPKQIKLTTEYTVKDLYTFVTIPPPAPLSPAALSELQCLGALLEVPQSALSTPLLKLICQKIQVQLYRNAFLASNPPGGLSNVIVVNLAAKPHSFVCPTILQPGFEIPFIGAVAVTRTKPAFRL